MRLILISIGTLCVVLGTIGVFLPVLPTTPFLLLAAACYMRSSRKLLQRLMDSKLLGPYLRDYYGGKGIPLRAKIISISLLWVSLICSMVFFINLMWVRIFLIFIGISVTIFIATRKTKKDEDLTAECGKQTKGQLSYD